MWRPTIRGSIRVNDQWSSSSSSMEDGCLDSIELDLKRISLNTTWWFYIQFKYSGCFYKKKTKFPGQTNKFEGNKEASNTCVEFSQKRILKVITYP